MNNRWTPYLVLAVMPLFFVSNLVIGRVAVATVSPWTLAFLRWLLACLILAPFALRQVRAHEQEIRAEWRRIALLGFLGSGVMLATSAELHPRS